MEGGDNFGVIGAWAWALSRALDYLETERAIDAGRVAVLGWSRLGKAAVWAGATDPRFAMVISIQSGAGGVKLFRRGVGEDIARLTRHFPYWYCRNFQSYLGKDRELPWDQHEMLALVAPRPVYVSSAEDDRLADPEGEFMGLKAVEPVYRLYGKPGLPVGTWPGVREPAQGWLGYHLREGGHQVTAYDWEQYLAFADRHLAKPVDAAH
jgi:hypothetical protein